MLLQQNFILHFSEKTPLAPKNVNIFFKRLLKEKFETIEEFCYGHLINDCKLKVCEKKSSLTKINKT